MAWKVIIMSVISGLNDHRQTPIPTPTVAHSPPLPFLSVSLFLMRDQALIPCNWSILSIVFLTAERSSVVLPNSRTQFPHAMSTSTKEGPDSQVEGSEWAVHTENKDPDFCLLRYKLEGVGAAFAGSGYNTFK